MEYDALKAALVSLSWDCGANPPLTFASQTTTIASLSHYQIQRSAIRVSAKSQLVAGGFGDIQQALLRRAGRPSIKVAVKKLRPAGTDYQRLRVAVASLCSCSPVDAHLNMGDFSSGACPRDDGLVSFEAPSHRPTCRLLPRFTGKRHVASFQVGVFWEYDRLP